MKKTAIPSNVKGNFGQGRMGSLILSQAIPLTLAQLVQVIYNVVDRMYIGHIPGEEAGAALTGVGLTFPLITLIAAFVNLFATGGAPLCSIARGKNDSERAKTIEANTFTMQIYVGLVSAVFLFILMKPLLYLFGASDITYPYAQQYLSIYLLGSVFLAVGTGMNGFINLQGFPRIGMCTTIIGAVLNLILDPVFIFGFNMGVQGAALATVISQFVSACWVILFLFGKKAVIPLKLRDLFHLDFSLLKEIVALGLSGFIMAATNSACQAVCNATLSIHGGDIYIGVMTIINSVREMISLPISGITSGAQPVLSYNYGAQNSDRVKQGIRFTAWVGFSYTFFMWLLVMIFPMVFLRLFTSEQSLIAAGKLPLIIYFAGFFMMSFQFAGQSTFVALGKPKQAIFFSLFRKIIIVVPLTFLLPYIGTLGVMGVFLAEPISNFIGGLASFLTMYITVYRKL